MKTGIELIAEERQRQIEVKGWTPEHDAEHRDGELAKMKTKKDRIDFLKNLHSTINDLGKNIIEEMPGNHVDEMYQEELSSFLEDLRIVKSKINKARLKYEKGI